MEKVTFFESIIKILEMISSVPFLIEILILTVLLLITMIFFYFRKSKKGKITTLIVYFTTLILLPVSHISFFVDVVDKIIENFVKTVYFPTWYIYIIMLIITDVGVLKELVKAIKEDKTKWINTFNFAYFFIFQFLFFLIVRLLSTNNINIFSQKEIYSNSLLLSIIQISSYLFWIRIGIKIIIFIINKLSGFEFKSKIKDKDLNNDINVVDNNDLNTDNMSFETNNNDIISNSFESNINNLIDDNINTSINSSYNIPVIETINIEEMKKEDNNIADISNDEEKIEIIDLDLEEDKDDFFDDFYN